MKRHATLAALALILAARPASSLDMAVAPKAVTLDVRVSPAARLTAVPSGLGTPVIDPAVLKLTDLTPVDVAGGMQLPAAALQTPAQNENARAEALPSLNQSEASFTDSVSKGASEGYSSGAKTYDGLRASAIESGDGGRVLEPSFEPPTFAPLPPGGGSGGSGGGGNGGGNGGGENPGETPRRPALSFANLAAKTALLAIEPSKAIYGNMKRLRGDGSKDYWGVYKKGVEIDVVIRGESVFGRPTTITAAFNKPVGKLTRDDIKGVVPEYQLKAPIKQLRQMFIDRLEEDRKAWHPNDEPVNLKTLVRVIKFKSYIDLYKEAHGAEAVPEPEPVKAREPLAVKAEGALKPLSFLKPRAVFVDLDLFDGPVPHEFLTDMAKLQRSGVYFVAFSRKPYSAPGGVREKLIRQMSSYQLSMLMPNRFMAVTDNGAVVSMLPKGGNVTPVDVLGFSPAAVEVLRNAAQKASEELGLAPREAVELAQPPIREAADEFPGLTRREGSSRKDPAVRFEIGFSQRIKREQVEQWIKAFERWMTAQGMTVMVSLETRPDGKFTISIQRTDLGGSFERLKKAMGVEFGEYLSPNDILVLSENPALKDANPHLDFARESGLKGAALADNAMGLMLAENRESQDGDRSGSASRISSFRRDRQQYMSEILIKEDAAEQNINFFSGHVVHSANDWVVHQLLEGKRPTEEEYRAELSRRWDAGTREFKAIGMPQGETTDGMLRESMQRGVSMYRMIVAAKDRGEILVGTEIPFEFTLKKYQKRSGAQKGRYHLHGQFDFVAIRPDPKDPTRGRIIIYDFKTGPAQSRQKLDKDIQVQLYTYFARHKWQGQDFPVPYFSGPEKIHIESVGVEFIYNAVKLPTTVTNQDMDKTRAIIIRTLDRIAKTEAQLLGEIAPKAKNAKAGKKKPAAKKTAKKGAPAAKKKTT